VLPEGKKEPSFQSSGLREPGKLGAGHICCPEEMVLVFLVIFINFRLLTSTAELED